MSRLQAGIEAPVFDAVAFNGERVRLSELQGNKVWLIFYRYFGCPLCHQHLFEIAARQQELEDRGIRVVAVFESARLKFGALKGREFPRFRLIPDPSQDLYDLFQVENRLSGLVHPTVAVRYLKALMSGFTQGKIDGNLGRMPAHFLIAEDGTVSKAHYGSHIADQIPWADVERFIAQAPRPVKRKASKTSPAATSTESAQ